MGTDTRKWNTGGRNIKLDQIESINMGSQLRDSASNVCSSGSKKGLCLVGWLLG